MVHDRASGTEFEVKVGLVFDGTRRLGRTRQALTGRTYVGGTRSWTTFAERFTATCARLGVFDAERIFFVSDGAAAIRWIRERSFPTAIKLLDWYHLVEALRAAIGPGGPIGSRSRKLLLHKVRAIERSVDLYERGELRAVGLGEVLRRREPVHRYAREFQLRDPGRSQSPVPAVCLVAPNTFAAQQPGTRALAQMKGVAVAERERAHERAGEPPRQWS